MKKKDDKVVLQYNMPSLLSQFINYLLVEISMQNQKKCFQHAVDNILSHAYHCNKYKLANKLPQVFPVLDNSNNLPSLTPKIQNESSLQIYLNLTSQVAGYV